MKKILNLRVSLALLLAASPLMSMADTFFSDNFTGASTLDQAPVTPTGTSTSYQTAAGLSGSITNISSGHISLTLTNTGSILGEFYGLFTNTPVALSAINDYIAIAVVFTNTQNILSGSAGASSTVNIGLFNSGGVAPNQGHIVLNAGNTTGGTQGWIGYAARIFASGSSTIFTRPAQTASGSSSQNQDLLFTAASSSQSFNSPSGATLGSTATSVSALAQGSTNTLYFVITLTAANTLTISNVLYAGAGVGGTVLATQTKSASGATFVASGFNGMAIGWRNSSSPAQFSTMDIVSVQVTGVSTPSTTPPSITSQPAPIAVGTNGSCAFTVTAFGNGLAYQWHRNGTNLLDGGNISGSTSAQLAIAPAGTADALSGANGYYVTVSGTGGYNTNSVTNSLVLVPVTNLLWTAAGGAVWDLNLTASWVDNNSTARGFNFGNLVTFDDTASIKTVNMTNTYLGAASVTVDTAVNYNFQGPGSFAGTGNMLIRGSGEVQIKNPNTFTGGTIISNATAFVSLQNINGLGNGPVTLAKAGGSMEIVPNGNSSSGINGNIIVADDFAITFKSVGTFAGTFFGNLSGTGGKVLTLTSTISSPFTNSRVRIYGTNTVYNADIFIDGPSTSQAQYDGFVLAPYNSSGSQTYNGVISGNGGFIQRGSGTTILSGANTYSGGTTPSLGTIGFGVDTVGAVTSGPIGTGPLNIAPEAGSANGNGFVFAYGGARTIANPIQYPSGTNNQTLVVGGTNNLTFTGSYALNGQDGLGSPVSRIFQVTNTGLTTISGVISDGGLGFGFNKTGSGVLALSSTETYTGPTLISGGTLAVNGALNSGSAVTATNGLLGGSGTVNGIVTIQNGGGVAPGNSIGTLTVNNNLTIQGGSTNFFEVNKGASTKDLVIVTGNAAYNGTLSVTNLSGTITTADTFQIFSVTGTKTGTFTNIIGSPGAGLAWSFTNSTGILGVIVGVATNPTSITTVVNNGKIELSWPADHTGWHLQVQTNTLSVGLLTNAASWVTIPNTDLNNKYTNTINAANGTVFYRMTYP